MLVGIEEVRGPSTFSPKCIGDISPTDSSPTPNEVEAPTFTSDVHEAESADIECEGVAEAWGEKRDGKAFKLNDVGRR
jgi:hypothetical protein